MYSPVLFMIFNRPETTRRVFAAIRAARPLRLYIAADGPRQHTQGEDALCAATRDIAKQVDWPCEVKTLFRKRNLGCAMAVSSAITWFFSHEEEGIILEDDTLPHQDFFRFCDTLLEYYRNDSRVMHISGNNFQLGLRRGEGSYYFSRFAHIWGWATWARAWRHFDLHMPGVREFLENELPSVMQDPSGYEYFRTSLLAVLRGALNTWDFPWSYAVMRRKGLCAMPNHNLVRNIGFQAGTHCRSGSIWEHVSVRPMPHIVHPASMQPDAAADDFTSRVVFGGAANFLPPLLQEARARLGTDDVSANCELLAVARAFYGDSGVFDELEELTLAAMRRKKVAA